MFSKRYFLLFVYDFNSQRIVAYCHLLSLILAFNHATLDINNCLS